MRPLNGLRAWRVGSLRAWRVGGLRAWRGRAVGVARGSAAGVAVGKLPTDATARAAVTVGAAKKVQSAIPVWKQESRRHGWQICRLADAHLNRRPRPHRHSGNSRSPASFLSHPHQKPATLPSTNHSFAFINATVIYFYTNFQPPPERTNDQSSQDDARRLRRVHRIESVESIHVESNRRIESVESICVEIVRAESICVESIRIESNRRIEIIHTEIICIESIEIIRIEIIRRNIIRKQTQIKRELKQSQTPTQHRKRRAFCRD